MDPSLLKLLEEDDEDESMHSKEDVDAFQASLIREIEGGNHSWSQQFAAWNNGITQDANTNKLHILESTQMKEQQQQSVLGSQDRELKPEDESPVQHNHNLPQYHLQPGGLSENPSHVPQASDLQSRNNSVSTEPENPQPLYMKLQSISVQRAHGLEQPVGSVNLGPTQLQVGELFRLLRPQVDKDRGTQLNTLFYKFKSNEVTKESFLRQARNILGERMILWAVRKLQQQQGNKGVKVPDGPNHCREPFTSADQSLIQSLTEGISAKKSDTCGSHDNQLHSTSSDTLSSSASVHGLHNSERPVSVNGPAMVHGGHIFPNQNNSSLPLNPAPCQGSVTKDQTMSNDQTVAHVKQKLTDQSFDQVRKPCPVVRQDVSNVPMEQRNGNPRRSDDDLLKQSSEMVLSAPTTHANFASPSVKTQLDSSTMVNFSAPAATILPGTIVRTTQGQKKTLEAQGSSLPPLSKRQKLCETSLAGSDKKFNDVTELSGINLMEEERELLSSLPKKDSRVFKSFRRVVHEEEGRTILQKVPLQRKLAEIMAKSGIKHIKDDVERCLSLCVEERMRVLLSNIIRTSKQRTNPEKCRNRICITSDIRKQINEMNQKEKDEQERKHGGEEKLKNDTAKEDKRSEQVKADKEQAEKRAKAANDAALASVGGDNVFSKWKLMAEARQKPSSETRRNAKKLSGGQRLGKKNHGSPKVVRSISVKDVIAVVEKEPQMSRSTLLYRLYDRICSYVPTQDKTEKLLISKTSLSNIFVSSYSAVSDTITKS
ncbi:PREDICTED: transcription initiation factor TFIID subunit 4-like isoform X1 [Brassica oleracea var. oleracea]|uniref:transcription initiation factor TFIID subunit 4-like isoform X1 n=1 Tax=Brassica oleracea var. oleracea TaxID=109376 RepID=UPI0006A6FAAF|nr:PREDICTED: transcription initiation factor TFIID subunit 4-like isoform X1 [Brassica oleracea var. oleracea]